MSNSFFMNVMGSRFEITSGKSMWVRTIYIVYKSSGRKMGGSGGGCGVLPFRMGRMWFKLAVTSSNQFLPVVAHDK